MKAIERFAEIYGRDAEGVAFCPYRVCPIGAHSDHNLGKITGLAIDKGIHIAYAPKQNGVVEMTSLQFPKSHWCCPPFYYYRKEDLPLVDTGIAEGCGTDAPGSFIAWLCTRTPVHAWSMPGDRLDIGNLESYERAQQHPSFRA